jgi:glycosyltransferase involved in cell wall biosynthesis
VQTILPRVTAVCLATFEPRPDLLARQLASLRAQTHAGWTCLLDDDGSSPDGWAVVLAAVGDDERFDVRRREANAGAYRAFEQLLERVPAGVAWFAPCDQDDVWAPDHLDALVAAGEAGGATLAFGDARVVRDDGAVVAPTYWTNRDEFHDDLGDLLATNTVTGAASVVRRDVLDVALPFPEEVAGSFHDHWLALCALALGDLVYLPRPVLDYVQHAANVTGHGERRRPGEPSSGDPRRVRAARDRARHLRRPQVMAQALLERAAERMAPEKRRAAHRTARGDRGLPGLLWVLACAAREQARPRRTLEARRRAARAALARRLGGS